MVQHYFECADTACFNSCDANFIYLDFWYFCASDCHVWEAVGGVFTIWEDCCLHKLDYLG